MRRWTSEPHLRQAQRAAADAVLQRDIGAAAGARPERPLRSRPTLGDRIVQAIMGSVFTTGLVVDDALTLRHVYGDASAFVTLPPGEPNLNLYAGHPSLRVEIRSMVMKALRSPEKSRWHTSRKEATTVSPGSAWCRFRKSPGNFHAFPSRCAPPIGLPEQSQSSRPDSAEHDRYMRGLEDQLAATARTPADGDRRTGNVQRGTAITERRAVVGPARSCSQPTRSSRPPTRNCRRTKNSPPSTRSWKPRRTNRFT